MCTDPSAKERDLSNEFTTQQLYSANEACTLAATQVLTQEADECWIDFKVNIDKRGFLE